MEISKILNLLFIFLLIFSVSRSNRQGCLLQVNKEVSSNITESPVVYRKWMLRVVEIKGTYVISIGNLFSYTGSWLTANSLQII